MGSLRPMWWILLLTVWAGQGSGWAGWAGQGSEWCANATTPRRSCGYANQPDECLAAGCCWHPLTPNPAAEPWCFHHPAAGGGRRQDSERLLAVPQPVYADDAAALCWLNESVSSCPNPLAGLPRLPKPHPSWPFDLVAAGGGVTNNFSRSPVMRDYARITHSVPIDMNFVLYSRPACQPESDPDGGATIFTETIREAVRLCAEVNCSLAANYSPFRACGPPCVAFLDNCTEAGPCDWPKNGGWEVGCWKSILQLADKIVKNTNSDLGSSVRFGSVLLDQEKFGVDQEYNATTRKILPNASLAKIEAVRWGNDAVYNATLSVWPDVAIDQYSRGAISRASGDCASPLCTETWVSSSQGPWCGPSTAGEGNEDVKPCGGKSSMDGRGDSFSCELYASGELQTTRETFNRTVNNAKAHGVSLVTPFLWLGGGSRRVVASYGGRFNDDRWNYELIDSWMLGLEINQDYYGRYPARFSQWGAAKRVAFYPSMFGDPSSASSPIQVTPCGNCSVRLQHFIAYVRGAANLTSLAGPEPYSNYALHACECVKTGPRGKKQRLLVHDVVVQTDVCNETYHDVCPPKAGLGGM